MRIAGGDNRPTDNYVVRASVESLGRAHCSGLIALRLTGTTNAGSHDHEVRTALPADAGNLVCRGYDAVKSSRPGEARQPLDLLVHSSADADLVEPDPIEAGQHRHGDHERGA